jgi:SWI/SNF-related matrix-associated actin-dependent regulator 1 of chromatin subfamily A
MGVGKSAESLLYAKEKGDKINNLLIVCPANVTYKWGIEVDKWYGKEWAVISKVKQDIPDVPVLIMSYTIMQKRALDLTDVPFDLLIADECHYLVNMESLRAKAIRRVVATRTLFLSGTPFLNRPVELFNLLNMINPIEWENYWAYTGRYCDRQQKWIGRGRKVWDVSGASNLDELRRRIEPIMLRRTKKDVLKDLPELTRTVLPLDNEYKIEYNRVWQELKEVAKIAKNLKSPEVLTRLTAVRQVVGMAKIKAAVELAEDILADPNEKVVVYAHHKMVVEKLVEELKEYGVATIVGEDNQQTRADVVDKFQNKQFPRVIVMSSAGAEGIDLWRASNLISVNESGKLARRVRPRGACIALGKRML